MPCCVMAGLLVVVESMFSGQDSDVAGTSDALEAMDEGYDGYETTADMEEEYSYTSMCSSPAVGIGVAIDEPPLGDLC